MSDQPQKPSKRDVAAELADLNISAIGVTAAGYEISISDLEKLLDLQRRREWLGYLADEAMSRGLLIEPCLDGRLALYEHQGGDGTVLNPTKVRHHAGPASAESLVLELRAKENPTFEWRAVAEVSTAHGSGFQSEWEAWEGPETDPEEIERLVNGSGSSMGFEAACDAAGFSYGIQVRKIGEGS